jgi:hypothetical protein
VQRVEQSYRAVGDGQTSEQQQPAIVGNLIADASNILDHAARASGRQRAAQPRGRGLNKPAITGNDVPPGATRQLIEPDGTVAILEQDA